MRGAVRYLTCCPTVYVGHGIVAECPRRRGKAGDAVHANESFTGWSDCDRDSSPCFSQCCASDPGDVQCYNSFDNSVCSGIRSRVCHFEGGASPKPAEGRSPGADREIYPPDLVARFKTTELAASPILFRISG